MASILWEMREDLLSIGNPKSPPFGSQPTFVLLLTQEADDYKFYLKHDSPSAITIVPTIKFANPEGHMTTLTSSQSVDLVGGHFVAVQSVGKREANFFNDYTFSCESCKTCLKCEKCNNFSFNVRIGKVYCKIKTIPVPERPVNAGVQTYQTLGAAASPYSEIYNLIKGGKLSDFRVKAGDKEIHAQKAILAASSPVFAKMIETEMREKREDCLVIKGHDPRAVEVMVQFLYTNRMDNALELAPDLFELAHIYDIKSLQFVCEDVLGSTLTIENCLSFLLLANKYNVLPLKAKVVDFIRDNRQTMSDLNYNLLESSLLSDLVTALLKS